MKLKSKEIKNLIPHIIASCILLMVFFVLVDVYEYLITEYYWIENKISYAKTGLFFLILVFLFTLVDWQKLLSEKNKLNIFLFLVFIITSIAHKKYLNYYSKLQEYPRAKSISKEWGTGGSWVKIEGKNFGLPHESGKVFLGEKETIIKKWEEDEIIFEVPIFEDENKLPILIKKINRDAVDSGFSYELRSL